MGLPRFALNRHRLPGCRKDGRVGTQYPARLHLLVEGRGKLLFKRSRARRSLSAHRARLWLEELDHRVLPSTRIWSGGGLDGNWTNALNWDGTAPIAGD